ncbi:MAG: hypothetical protein IPK81_24840 [Rhodospirillales bacterium]|nr:MAG: hypothetical protein IPK81_24840 [Rhodospirillales bacterium]
MSYAPAAASPSTGLDRAVAVGHRTSRRWNATICKSLVLILALLSAPVSGSPRAQPLTEVLRLALADGFTIDQFARALDGAPSNRAFDGESFRILALFGSHVEPRCRAALGEAIKATLGPVLGRAEPFAEDPAWDGRLGTLPLPDAPGSRHRSLVVIVGESRQDDGRKLFGMLDDDGAGRPGYFNGSRLWFYRANYGYWHRHDKGEKYSETILILLPMNPDGAIMRCDDVGTRAADLADAMQSDRAAVLQAEQEDEVPFERRTSFLMHQLRITSLLADVPPSERGAFLRIFKAGSR